ncbi:unnamed protein product [Alternaria alternata]
MFTPLVLRRNFSLSSRLSHSRIIRQAARDGHGSAIIQRVRIRRPFLSKSRLVGAIAIGVATYGLGQYVGITVEVEEVKEGEGLPGLGKMGGQQSGLKTTRTRMRSMTTLYYSYQPDSQDHDRSNFGKVQTPSGKSSRRSQRTAQGRTSSYHTPDLRPEPPFVAKAGKIDLHKGKTWVEFRFPDTRPDDGEGQPGRSNPRIIFAWKEYCILKKQRKRLYQDTTKKAGRAWKDFKIYMGWSQESQTEAVQQLVKRISANPQSTLNKTTSINPEPFSTSAKDTQQPGTTPSSAAPVDGPAKDLNGILLPDPKKLMLDLTQFRTDVRKASNTATTPMVIPRGGFWVLGLIEIYGERAKLTLNVYAIYDPKQERYVGMRARAVQFYRTETASERWTVGREIGREACIIPGVNGVC